MTDRIDRNLTGATVGQVVWTDFLLGMPVLDSLSYWPLSLASGV